RPIKPIDPTEAHVLVVEDNVPNFVLIARLLAYMGVPRCEWKTSGWQVVEFADTLPRIDLILMDIRLPYEDGFQALEKVRASERFKDTLVVAVTAEASVEQMKRAQECGFDGFLGKPLDPDRFPDRIRRVRKGGPVWQIHWSECACPRRRIKDRAHAEAIVPATGGSRPERRRPAGGRRAGEQRGGARRW